MADLLREELLKEVVAHIHTVRDPQVKTEGPSSVSYGEKRAGVVRNTLSKVFPQWVIKDQALAPLFNMGLLGTAGASAYGLHELFKSIPQRKEIAKQESKPLMYGGLGLGAGLLLPLLGKGIMGAFSGDKSPEENYAYMQARPEDMNLPAGEFYGATNLSQEPMYQQPPMSYKESLDPYADQYNDTLGYQDLYGNNEYGYDGYNAYDGYGYNDYGNMNYKNASFNKTAALPKWVSNKIPVPGNPEFYTTPFRRFFGTLASGAALGSIPIAAMKGYEKGLKSPESKEISKSGNRDALLALAAGLGAGLLLPNVGSILGSFSGLGSNSSGQGSPGVHDFTSI